MNDGLYLLQLVGGGAVIAALFGRRDAWTSLYVAAWTAINVVLVLRYGIDGQLTFYSNDQRYYVEVVGSIVRDGPPVDVDWWATASRWPYTLPAGLLSLAGVDPALSAKIVSLLALLATVRFVRSRLSPRSTGELIVDHYLTALGAIGVFFSVLALRETTMMLLVAIVFLGRSPAHRAAAAILLFFLRQHLAVAVVVGILVVTLVRRRSTPAWSPLWAVLTVVGGNAAGYLAFSLGFEYVTGSAGVFGHRFGIEPVLRILSNYVGLQFLTASETSLEFSLSSLVLSRLAFSETIVIPALFTFVMLTSRRLDHLGWSVLLGFSIYVGLVTNTDFNSFRQNIPLMPMMGLVVAARLPRRATARTATGSRET